MAAYKINIVTGGPVMQYDHYRYSSSLKWKENGKIYFSNEGQSVLLETSCIRKNILTLLFLYYK